MNDYLEKTITVKDYVFCNYIANSWGFTMNENFYMNEDSVFRIFKESFSKLKISSLLNERGVNHCDSRFEKDWQSAINADAEQRVLEISDSALQIQLVPIISFRSSYQGGMYFTSGGSVGGSRYLMYNALILTIYLVESGVIVYKRTAAFQADPYPAYDIMEIHHVITQKDWDELVALVMKDYIERLRE